jgi:hypothetical protein
VLALVAVGCARSEGIDDVDASARETGPGVKPYYVKIEVLPVATREVSRTEDGQLLWGELMPLEGADVCVKYIRPAFASFTPFEALREPRCAKSVGVEPVVIGGVPSNSDLIVTIAKDGYMPIAQTARTSERDHVRPDGWYPIRTVARRTGVFDPWLEGELTPEAGLGEFFALMGDWNSHAHPRVPGGDQPFSQPLQGFAFARDGTLRVEQASPQVERGAIAAPAVEPFDLEMLAERPRYVPLPSGIYRVTAEHPRAHCRASGVEASYVVTGFWTAEPNVLEMPLLAGYTSGSIHLCDCPFGPGDVLADLSSCTIDHAGN